MDEIFTVKEAAAYLKCDHKTVRRMMDRGQLTGVLRTGSFIRIPKSSIDQMFK